MAVNSSVQTDRLTISLNRAIDSYVTLLTSVISCDWSRMTS